MFDHTACENVEDLPPLQKIECSNNCICFWSISVSCINSIPVYFKWKIISLKNVNFVKKNISKLFPDVNIETVHLEILQSSLKSTNILHNLKNLVKLNLTSNEIFHLNMKTFSSKTFQIFILNKNTGIFEIKSNINPFPNSLRAWSITFSRVFIHSFDIFKTNENLIYLNLSSTFFNNFNSKLFKSFPNLEILDIRNIQYGRGKTLNSKRIFDSLLKLTKLYSSRYQFCCYLESRENLKVCQPKKLKDTSSCKELISSKFLKGIAFKRK